MAVSGCRELYFLACSNLGPAFHGGLCFPEDLGDFRGVFSLFIINFAGRIRKAARGGGTRSAPIFVFKSLKRRKRAAHGRARAAKPHWFVIYSHDQLPRLSFCFRLLYSIFLRDTAKIRCEEFQPQECCSKIQLTAVKIIFAYTFKRLQPVCI